MSIEELYAQLGGNYEEAKSRLMNDVLIKRFLLKFANEYDIALLEQAGNACDGKAIFEAAHSLKGVAGNLALTSLCEKASALTERTRSCVAGEKVDETAAIEEILALHRQAVALIKENLQ